MKTKLAQKNKKKSEDKASTQGRKEIIFLLKIVFVWSKCQTSFECK
jgi:hypothetical protein